MNKILDNYLFEAFASASDNIFVYVSDVKTDMSRWSKKAVDFFGLEGEYFTNAAYKWREHIHPDDRAIYEEDLIAVFSGEKSHHNCQYRAKNKYGEYVWVECRGSILRDDKGEPIVFAGIMTWLDNQNKYDSLTHLLTGYELFRCSCNENGSVMLIGVDRLRDINSQHGLLYGNRIIVRLAHLLEKYADSAVVYRFQGDEFAVFGKGISVKKMISIFNKVQKECKETENECDLINFPVSAGITAYKEGDDITDVLAKAELSISFAKNKTTSKYEVYSSEIEAKHTRKNLVSEELIRSIKNKFEGFYLVYQPIMSNEGNRVVGCEALLRWKVQNKEIGACYPDEFIPILESNGGIMDVGYFVMEESIKRAGEWQKKYHKFNVSFNVSYLQLEDPKFVPAIIDNVKKYKVDPTHVVVELTESVLAADTIMVKASFEMLKQHGIKIALDDFGTGNSSFWMLHNIEVDIVKLDQSFIRGLDSSGSGIDYAIVESVGLMCNRIGCGTVAEGVETNDIKNMISRFSFTGLQGYLFSRPIEPPAFEELLEGYNMRLPEDEIARRMDTSYEDLVDAVRKAIKELDTSWNDTHLAVEFDIVGKGKGAFYIEFTEEGVVAEPYDYRDNNVRVRCSADIAKDLVKGKKNIANLTDAVLEGSAESIELFSQYLSHRKVKAGKKTKKK